MWSPKRPTMRRQRSASSPRRDRHYPGSRLSGALPSRQQVAREADCVRLRQRLARITRTKGPERDRDGDHPVRIDHVDFQIHPSKELWADPNKLGPLKRRQPSLAGRKSPKLSADELHGGEALRRAVLDSRPSPPPWPAWPRSRRMCLAKRTISVSMLQVVTAGGQAQGTMEIERVVALV